MDMRRPVVSASTFAAAVALLATTHADALEHPWCLQYTLAQPSARFAMLSASPRADTGTLGPSLKQAQDGGGGRNCGFDSFEQCMEARQGAGGFCEQNPFYEGPADPRTRAAPNRRPRRDR
jgi:hypothetical protein